MNPALENLVANRPLPERPSAHATCPYCGSRELTHHGTMSTLIGGGDGTRDGDPNHRTSYYTCVTCRGRFTRETKSGNVWYTAMEVRVEPSSTDDTTLIMQAMTTALGPPKLLRGVTNCFEAVAYTCAHCGGSVTRRHTQPDGRTPTSTLSYSFDTGERGHRTFFGCASCMREIEVTDE